MKQREAVKAYLAVRELNKQKMSSGRNAKKIFDLYKKLEKYWDFQGQEETKVYQKYPDIDFSKGSIDMKDMSPSERLEMLDKVNKINTELAEIGKIEIDDAEFEKFTIEFDSEPNLSISGEDIGALENFISFE